MKAVQKQFNPLKNIFSDNKYVLIIINYINENTAISQTNFF